MIFSEQCSKIDFLETMTDDGSCIRVRSLVSALKATTKEDVEGIGKVLNAAIPLVNNYFEQAFELWRAAQGRTDLKLVLEPNDELSLGAFAYLPIDAPHDQINEEIFR